MKKLYTKHVNLQLYFLDNARTSRKVDVGFLLSMIKFIGGPLSAIALGLEPPETIVFSVLGMMTSVVIFSFVGIWIKDNVFKKFIKPKALFTKRNRQLIGLWSKYGIQGVAFLTPVIFSPIVGTLLAASFGESKLRIFLYMLASAIFWGIILSFSFYHLKGVFIHH